LVEVMGEEIVEEGEEGGEAFGGEMVLARSEGEGADAGDDFVVALEAGVGGLGVLGIGGDAWVEDIGADGAPDGFVVGVHFVEVGIFGGARGFGAAFGDGVVGLVFGGAENSREIFASVFGIEVEVSDPTGGFGGGFGGEPVGGGEVFGDDDEGVVWAEGFTIAAPVADALGREGAIVEEVDGELLATVWGPEEATEGSFVLFEVDEEASVGGAATEGQAASGIGEGIDLGDHLELVAEGPDEEEEEPIFVEGGDIAAGAFVGVAPAWPIDLGGGVEH